MRKINPVGSGLSEVIVDGALTEVSSDVVMTAEADIMVESTEVSIRLVLSMWLCKDDVEPIEVVEELGFSAVVPTEDGANAFSVELETTVEP